MANRRAVPTEEEDQIAFMTWLGLAHPEVWRRTWHTPNGGVRCAGTAGRMRALGVKVGVPDLITPLPSADFVGLAVEVKRAGLTASSVRPEQREWLGFFESIGYQSVVAFGYDGLMRVYADYFGWQN